jgi:hypothetical protein
VSLGFPGNRESAQEELDRAAARTAIVSFHFSNGRPRELGARALVDRLRRPSAHVAHEAEPDRSARRSITNVEGIPNRR